MNHVCEKDTYRTGEYSRWYPCISVDGSLFIWTSMTKLFVGAKGRCKVRALTNVIQVQEEAKKCLRMKLK